MKKGIYYNPSTLEMVEVSYDSFFKAICIVTRLTRRMQIVGQPLDKRFKYLGKV